MNKDFWRSKRVLVTGHTGFKGGWLSLWLQSAGATVRGFALEAPTEPSLFNVARVSEEMEHQVADIRNYDAVSSAMKEFKPDIVFHMAAQPLVRFSYHSPVETYATNVMGTVHVLDAALRAGSAKAIVNITTDKCYENREWLWGYREDEPMGGRDPYSSSKGCAELVSSAYRKSFLQEANVAMATVRAGNVIGGGDWAKDRLIPDILRAFDNKRPVLVRNPDAVRPWQHVLEPIFGYLSLAERLFEEGDAYAEGWNFGPSEEDARPVQWIVERMCQQWGNGSTWDVHPSDSLHEANYLKLDISKARNRLDWRPRWSLDKALNLIVEWHRAWLNGYDMRAFCISQISNYRAEL